MQEDTGIGAGRLMPSISRPAYLRVHKREKGVLLGVLSGIT
jgi:hypothetical protein